MPPSIDMILINKYLIEINNNHGEIMETKGKWGVVAAFVLSIVLFLALLTVCFSDNTGEVQAQSVNPEKQVYVEKVERYMEELRAGNTSVIYQDASQEFIDEFPESKFSEQLASMFQMLGEYIVTTNVGVELRDDYVTVIMTEEYFNDGDRIKSTLATMFVFDATTDELMGFKLKVPDTSIEAPEPQSSDKWEEIVLTVGEKYKLHAILTLPKNVDNPPVVILVHGSGPNDMNETIGKANNAPFEDIAHGLADQGIASLRYDKRTLVYPESFVGDYTIQDEVLDDVKSAIKQISQNEVIDSERIYVIGHSLGGALVPVIAQENPEVKGVVSLAGSLRGLEDLMYDQNMLILKNSGYSDEEIAQMAIILDQQRQAIKNITPDDDSLYYMTPASYWYSHNSYDRAANAQQLEIPMLILQGADDFQVYADVDYPLWQETLADKSNVTYNLYEGLNHLFMESDSQKDVVDTTVYDKPANVDQQVIDDIANWINNL